MVQHKANERILKHKLEAYQKNFPNFICSSPTSTKVSNQDEETKAGPSGIVHKEEMQTKEPHDLRSGTIHEEEVQPKKP